VLHTLIAVSAVFQQQKLVIWLRTAQVTISALLVAIIWKDQRFSFEIWLCYFVKLKISQNKSRTHMHLNFRGGDSFPVFQLS
jgi:hypothetical protein